MSISAWLIVVIYIVASGLLEQLFSHIFPRMSRFNFLEHRILLCCIPHVDRKLSCLAAAHRVRGRTSDRSEESGRAVTSLIGVFLICIRRVDSV